MSSAHCGHCGAMSTIWLPTCVFCGHSVNSPTSATKPRSRIRRAVFDDPAAATPCTERKEAARRAGFFELLRVFWARMRQRLPLLRT